MDESNRTEMDDHSRDELIELQLAAPMCASNENGEIWQLDKLLAGMRNVHNFGWDRVGRLQHNMEIKEAAFKAVASEKDNLSAILMSSKANYYSDLLEAERKIKNLENELNEMKAFITRDVLQTTEKMSTMIKHFYRDGHKNCVASSGRSPTIETLDTTKTVEPVPDATPMAATAPKAEPQKENTAEIVEPSTSNSEHNVVEITYEVPNGTGAQMQAAEESLPNGFSCDKCSRSFATLSRKFRHETRAHRNKRDVGQQTVRVAAPKKPLKRLRPVPRGKKLTH